MLNLLIFILCSFGLTQILLYGKILDSIRPKEGKLGELFKCSLCMGFWTGILLAILDRKTLLFSLPDDGPITIILMGFISSGCVYVLDRLFCDNGLNINIRGENNDKK